MEENHINLHSQFDIVSYSLVKDFAKIGMGISYITKEFTKSELESNDLYKIPLLKKYLIHICGIITTKSTINTLASQKLIDMILSYRLK